MSEKKTYLKVNNLYLGDCLKLNGNLKNNLLDK